MLEIVHVVKKIAGTKSVVVLPKAEWFGKEMYRVVLVLTNGEEISRVMSKHDFDSMVATGQIAIIKVSKGGRIIE